MMVLEPEHFFCELQGVETCSTVYPCRTAVSDQSLNDSRVDVGIVRASVVWCGVFILSKKYGVLGRHRPRLQ